MLVELLTTKMKEMDLSLRATAKQIGISHTTIARILKGDQVDMKTLVAIANWLDISPSNFLGTEGKAETTLSEKIAAVLESEPKLKDMFEDTIRRIERGEVSSQLISEIVAYAKFKVDMEQMRNKGKLSVDPKQK